MNQNQKIVFEMWRKILIDQHERKTIGHQVSEIWLIDQSLNNPLFLPDNVWYIKASFKCCENQSILYSSKKIYDRIQGDQIKFPIQIYDSSKEILICKNS